MDIINLSLGGGYSAWQEVLKIKTNNITRHGLILSLLGSARRGSVKHGREKYRRSLRKQGNR